MSTYHRQEARKGIGRTFELLRELLVVELQPGALCGGGARVKCSSVGAESSALSPACPLVFEEGTDGYVLCAFKGHHVWTTSGMLYAENALRGSA